MNEYSIDISDITTKKQLHRLLKRELEFPEYYGENLDALKDALTDLPDGTKILITGLEDASRALESYMRSFRRVVADVQRERPDMEITLAE